MASGVEGKVFVYSCQHADAYQLFVDGRVGPQSEEAFQVFLIMFDYLPCFPFEEEGKW